MATKEELLKRKRKNIENLKKKNKENLLVRTIKSPFRGAGHILRTAGSTAMMPVKGAGHILRTAKNTATMPIRGAKNLIGAAKYGAKTAYKVGKSGFKQMQKNSAAAKERRKKLGIGEFKKRPSSKKKDNLTVTTPKSSPKSSGKTTKSNVFTKHYKTGKELGVMTRRQRRAYDKEAAGRTYQPKKRKK